MKHGIPRLVVISLRWPQGPPILMDRVVPPVRPEDNWRINSGLVRRYPADIASSLRICPETSYGIAKFSEHKTD